MSLFGNMFGKKEVEKKEPEKKKSGKKHKKKNISKGKVKKKTDDKIKKSDKKKFKNNQFEKKVKKKKKKVNGDVSHYKKADDILFNSQNEIQKYYRDQRKKAKDLLKEIERKKAFSLINVAQKHLNQIVTERKNLEVLHKDLRIHLNRIVDKIKETSLQKKNNIYNIKLVIDLKKSMVKLTEEAGSIIDVRRKLIDKEKRIVNKMKKIVSVNEDSLKKSDPLSSNRLMEVEARKERLISDTNDLMSQEKSSMVVDDRILDTIGKSAQKKIIKLNKKLKNLKKDSVDVLKKVELLNVSREKAREKIKDSLKQIELLKKKYAKVLGIKNKK
ncbi:hypothetical protein GOV12_06720 [Candidatus Pacearchaeota archaeon]|nr:hypothetical protein [Candidatus Pacearchaeota archaeon]